MPTKKSPAKAASASVKSNAGVSGSALKAQASTWQEVATPDAGSFAAMPDGKYRAKIEEAVIEKGGKDRNRLQVKWPFRIVGPTHENRMAWMNTGLSDAIGIEFTKRVLVQLELEVPGAIEELPATLAKAKGLVVDINLKTKETDAGTFQNTYLNKLVKEDDADAGPGKEEEQVNFVGKTVEFDSEDGAIRGKVLKQDGDNLTIKDQAGDNWEAGIADVRIVESKQPAKVAAKAKPKAEVEEAPAEEPAEEPSEEAPASDWLNKTVEFSDDRGKKLQGKVIADNGEGALTVTVGSDEWEVPSEEVKEVKVSGPKKAVAKKK